MINNFTTRGENVHLYEPLSSTSPPSTLIILCTWLGGATPRNIAKYTSGYQTHFPSASILLLTTTVYNFGFRSLSAIHAALSPARETITRFLISNSFPSTNPSTSTEKKILLHFISHGGGSVAVDLAQSLLTSNPETHRSFTAALKLVVLDCCPGDDSFMKFYNATAMALPRTTLAQTLGPAVLYPFCGVFVSLQRLGVARNIPALRRDLNSDALFGRRARRVYVYSKGDEMVPWGATEEHLREARERGFEVSAVRFEREGHCALVLADGGRYWRGIVGAWEGEEGGEERLEVRSRL